jgi:hypothetical protein
MNKSHLILTFCASVLTSTSFAALSHAGHGTQAPWQACEEKKLNQSCDYINHNQKAIGTCQSMNEVLMCVRNRPLQPLTNEEINALEKPNAAKSLIKETSEKVK